MKESIETGKSVPFFREAPMQETVRTRQWERVCFDPNRRAFKLGNANVTPLIIETYTEPNPVGTLRSFFRVGVEKLLWEGLSSREKGQTLPGTSTEVRLKDGISVRHAVMIMPASESEALTPADLPPFLRGIVQKMNAGFYAEVDPSLIMELKNCPKAVMRLPKNKNGIRFDSIDPVTDEKVVNIPMHTHLNRKTGDSISDAFEQALIRTKNKQPVNMTELVKQCEIFFPGFKETLTDDEQSRLPSADSALCEKCLHQFMRLHIGNEIQNAIPKIDTALNTHIRPLVSKIRSIEIRKAIEGALNAWEENLYNPLPNYHYLQTRNGEQNAAEYGAAMLKLHPNFFSIAKMFITTGNQTEVGGAMEVRWRTMFIKTQEEPYDFLDALNFIHEIIHLCQQNDVITHYQKTHSKDAIEAHHATIGFLKKVEGPVHAILEEEYETNAAMIELLMARLDSGTWETDQIGREIGVNLGMKDKRDELNQILKFASVYSTSKTVPGKRYSPEYMRAVEELYRRGASAVYSRAPDGTLNPV